MMKNTEWGAVAYLQHSAYGSHISVRINNNESFLTGYSGVNEPTTGFTGTNISCSSNLNACNEYGIDTLITNPWNTAVGFKASTTGNISGIYDMSGGVWKYVMGVMTTQSGVLCSGRNSLLNSGFHGPYCYTDGSLLDGISDFPTDTRYYDTYGYATDDEHYNRRILGDATGEMGPFADRTYGTQVRQVSLWHDDEGWFVNSFSPCFCLGGRQDIGIGSGIFSFRDESGYMYSIRTFRIALTAK